MNFLLGISLFIQALLLDNQATELYVIQFSVALDWLRLLRQLGQEAIKFINFGQES